MGYFIWQSEGYYSWLLNTDSLYSSFIFFSKKKKKEVLKPPSTLEFFLLFIDLGEQKEELQK